MVLEKKGNTVGFLLSSFLGLFKGEKWATIISCVSRTYWPLLLSEKGHKCDSHVGRISNFTVLGGGNVPSSQEWARSKVQCLIGEQNKERAGKENSPIDGRSVTVEKKAHVKKKELK